MFLNEGGSTKSLHLFSIKERKAFVPTENMSSEECIDNELQIRKEVSLNTFWVCRP